MGSRGPTKKQKLGIAGSIQPAREFDTAIPACLTDIAGRVAWKETVDVLREMVLLHIADKPAIISYCELHDRLAEYATAIAEDGELYELPNGCKAIHPACKLRDKAEKAINDFRRQYGMTAVSRAGLNVGGTKAKPALASRKRG